MDLAAYELLSSETLESLTDYFEEIVDADPKLAKADVAYSVSSCSKHKLKALYMKRFCTISGRCFDCEAWRSFGNVRYKPTNSKSTNLAQFTHFGPKKI